MKFFNGLLIISISMLFLGACKQNSDGPKNSNVSAESVTSVGLVKTWISNYGDALTINVDGSLRDSLCDMRGSAVNISRNLTCPAGYSSCGAITLDIKQTNGSSDCQKPGTYICTYFLTRDAMTMRLACNGNESTEFQAAQGL